MDIRHREDIFKLVIINIQSGNIQKLFSYIIQALVLTNLQQGENFAVYRRGFYSPHFHEPLQVCSDALWLQILMLSVRSMASTKYQRAST